MLKELLSIWAEGSIIERHQHLVRLCNFNQPWTHFDDEVYEVYMKYDQLFQLQHESLLLGSVLN